MRRFTETMTQSRQDKGCLFSTSSSRKSPVMPSFCLTSHTWTSNSASRGWEKMGEASKPKNRTMSSKSRDWDAATKWASVYEGYCTEQTNKCQRGNTRRGNSNAGGERPCMVDFQYINTYLTQQPPNLLENSISHQRTAPLLAVVRPHPDQCIAIR